jgi:hypothetical protein
MVDLVEIETDDRFHAMNEEMKVSPDLVHCKP